MTRASLTPFPQKADPGGRGWAGTARSLAVPVGNQPRDSGHGSPTRGGTRPEPLSGTGTHPHGSVPSHLRPSHVLPARPWNHSNAFGCVRKALGSSGCRVHSEQAGELWLDCSREETSQVSHCFAHTNYLNRKGTKTRLEPSLETRFSSFGHPQ